MRSHEHPVLPFFRQAEIIWNQFPGTASVPLPARENIQRLFTLTKLRPEMLTVRAQDLDSAVRLFNSLKRRHKLSQAEPRTLARELPKDFRLPTLPQLARNTRQSEPFFGMVMSRIRRGDYGFTQHVTDPGPLSSIAILASYSLAVHRILIARGHAVGSGFDNTLISGLSTMMNPKSPLYRDIFQTPS